MTSQKITCAARKGKNAFYVYTLTDPRCGSVFYVGKGKGRRLHEHEAEARKGVYSRKCETIRSIWSAGLEVSAQKVSFHHDENEALAEEARLIDDIGLANLTNVVPGGTMGAEVYLQRVKDAERRKQVENRRKSVAMFKELAPTFAAALNSENYGADFEGRWIEARDGYVSVFWASVQEIGIDTARKVMRPYGVEIV